jgi:AcrR family transcriptional regulator
VARVEPMTTGTGSRPASVPLTRRQRLREATSEEIKTVARDLMAREGTASLNLRAIAREMGMTPSALYRYYPSRDAILTALITDAYDSVGEAVERAIDEAREGPGCTPILAGAHTFRRWALEHPQEYGLIYGSPVPGYEAPHEETMGPAMRTSLALLELLSRAIAKGILTVPPDGLVPDELHPALDELSREKNHHVGAGELSIAGWAMAMQFWVVLHGILSAEVFGHLPAELVAHGESFFDFTMRRALVALGLDPVAVAEGVSPAPRDAAPGQPVTPVG